MTVLSEWEGRDVVQATIRITGAGDGLSDAMSIAPVDYHIGDKVYVVIESTVTKVTHDEIKDTDTLRRKHGHPLSGDNLFVTAQGYRVCLCCRRAIGRRHDERRRAVER